MTTKNLPVDQLIENAQTIMKEATQDAADRAQRAVNLQSAARYSVVGGDMLGGIEDLKKAIELMKSSIVILRDYRLDCNAEMQVGMVRLMYRELQDYRDMVAAFRERKAAYRTVKDGEVFA